MEKKQKNSGRRGGCLIVFEGIDGTGKSTQIDLLAAHLRTGGYDVVATKEPTEGEYGRRIRALYLNREEVSREEELDLFLRDRHEHVKNLIQPALAEGRIILCDRYYLSTMAYQGAAGMDIQDIVQKNSFAPEPHLALLFQLSPHRSIERIRSRGDRLNDFEQEKSLEKVEAIFNSLSYPYIHRIDADQTIEDVHHAVRDVVCRYLEKPECS